VIWNRTDCCGYRLADYWVFVSDTPFSPTDTLATLQAHPGTMYMHMTTAPNPSTAIPFGNAARYIRLVSGATDYLSLAEVQVMVSSVSGSSGASSLGQVAVPAREHP
jgi:alpha-L-fucosidase